MRGQSSPKSQWITWPQLQIRRLLYSIKTPGYHSQWYLSTLATTTQIILYTEMLNLFLERKIESLLKYKGIFYFWKWNLFQWTCIEAGPCTTIQYNTIQYMYAPLPSSEEVLRVCIVCIAGAGRFRVLGWYLTHPCEIGLNRKWNWTLGPEPSWHSSISKGPNDLALMICT